MSQAKWTPKWGCLFLALDRKEIQRHYQERPCLEITLHEKIYGLPIYLGLWDRPATVESVMLYGCEAWALITQCQVCGVITQYDLSYRGSPYPGPALPVGWQKSSPRCQAWKLQNVLIKYLFSWQDHNYQSYKIWCTKWFFYTLTQFSQEVVQVLVRKY